MRRGLINNDFTGAAGEAFDALIGFIEANGLWPQVDQCLGIQPDDSSTTPPEENRYYAGFILREGSKVEPSGEVGLYALDAGRCAVFMHKCSYETLWQTWNAAYREWLPASGEELRDAPPYEVYLYDKCKTRPEDLRTEIHIPIK